MIRADEKNVEIIIPAPDSECPVIVEKVGVDNKAYNNTNEYKGKNYWRIRVYKIYKKYTSRIQDVKVDSYRIVL